MKSPDSKTLVGIAAGAGGCLLIAAVVVFAVVVGYWIARDESPSTGATPAVPAPVEGVPSAAAVTLEGRVVDSRTREPVPSALVMVLPSGGTPGDTPLVGYTDAEGIYRVQVARGRSYVAEVAANGYATSFYSEGVSIAEDDPASLRMEDVLLDPL